MTDIDYTRLLLSNNLPYNENIIIKVPTIREIVELGQDEFREFIKPFSITVREIFSGMPDIVDQMEDSYPTLWDMCFDQETNKEIGNNLSKHNKTLQEVMIDGFAYWTQTEKTGFRFLTNKKMINKELNWVVDISEFKKFASFIKTITLTKTNEDLIAPKGMSKGQRAIWLKIYQGRIRKLKKAKKLELGESILILEGAANSFIPFEDVKNMTYYQFSNLVNTYTEKEASDKNFQIYTAYKFDTKKMKLTNWRENISLERIEGVD